jgi:hypothetical protein
MAVKWCAREGVAPGGLLTTAATWQLAQAWYADRLDPDFLGRTEDEARDIFKRLGLVGKHWKVG